MQPTKASIERYEAVHVSHIHGHLPSSESNFVTSEPGEAGLTNVPTQCGMRVT